MPNTSAAHFWKAIAIQREGGETTVYAGHGYKVLCACVGTALCDSNSNTIEVDVYRDGKVFNIFKAILQKDEGEHGEASFH